MSGFRKMNILGYEDFVDIYIFMGGGGGRSSQDWTISKHFRVFSLGQGTEWEYVWGLLKFQIFFIGMPDIPDMFLYLGLNSRCWVQAYGE